MTGSSPAAKPQKVQKPPFPTTRSRAGQEAIGIKNLASGLNPKNSLEPSQRIGQKASLKLTYIKVAEIWLIMLQKGREPEKSLDRRGQA